MVLNAGRTMAETIIAPQRLKTKKTRQSQLGGASPGKLRRLEAKKTAAGLPSGGGLLRGSHLWLNQRS